MAIPPLCAESGIASKTAPNTAISIQRRIPPNERLGSGEFAGRALLPRLIVKCEGEGPRLASKGGMRTWGTRLSTNDSKLRKLVVDGIQFFAGLDGTIL